MRTISCTFGSASPPGDCDNDGLTDLCVIMTDGAVLPRHAGGGFIGDNSVLPPNEGTAGFRAVGVLFLRLPCGG